jgi:CDP-diacylglycerol--glycerol-3-phosphate 3-phosphatidyltransferase
MKTVPVPETLRARRPHPARVRPLLPRAPEPDVIKQKLGSKLDGWIHAVVPFLFKRELNPNLLTMLGVVVSCAAAVALGLGHFVAGGVLILFGGFFDLVDGVVARHFKIQTQFGAFLDSTMDRLVDMVILFGVLVYFANIGDVGVVLLAAVVLTGSVMTSYTKARAELVVPQMSSGFFERGERNLQHAIGANAGLIVPALWVLAVGTTLTAIQRFAIAARELGASESTPEPPAGEPLKP